MQGNKIFINNDTMPNVVDICCSPEEASQEGGIESCKDLLAPSHQSF
jgi:hypothetical protein